MAPEGLKRHLGLQVGQYADHLPHPQHQGGTEAGQIRLEIGEGFGAEGPLARGGIALGPEFRLHHVEGQHGTAARGLPQGAMVVHPQIPLEQNDVDSFHGPAP